MRPNVGDPITVATPHGLHATHVGGLVTALRVGLTMVVVGDPARGPGISLPIAVRLADEGITWCRGHDGPAVLALAAAYVLSERLR